MRLATRLGAVLAATTFVVGGLPAASASAAPAADGETCIANLHPVLDSWITEGCFVGYGDVVVAWDFAEDGRRSVTEWETDYGRSGECHNAKGVGKRVDCNYDMSETGRIKIRSCARDGASAPNWDCTRWSGWISISTGEYV